MAYFIVKITRDVDGNVTDRDVVSKGDSDVVPRNENEYVAVYGSDDIALKNAGVQVSNNGMGDFLEIIEDSAKKAVSDQEDEIELRKKRMEFGKRLIAVMSIRNDAKSLTPAQIVQFANDYADINTALLNGSISTAMGLIDAIVPDGTITTQADKDALAAEFTAAQSELGY